MRQSWTDDRLDDLARRVDSGFNQVHEDIAALRSGQERLGSDSRAELRGEIGSVRAEIGALRAEMNARLEALEARFDRLQATMVGGFISIFAALIATRLF